MATFHPEELRSALRVKLSDRTTVVGAQLGALIKEVVPDVDFRTEYGGLKPFVVRFLNPDISWTGKSGMDDLYAVNAEVSSEAAGGLLPASRAASELWQIFSNPTHSGVIFVVPNTGELFVSTGETFPQEGESDARLRPVRTLSPEHQKRIALEWIDGSTLAPDVRARLQQLLESDGYWWRLFTWFRNEASPELRESWISHRHNRIRQEFAVALEDAGVSPEHVAILGRLLLDSKKKGTAKRSELRKSNEQSRAISEFKHSLSLKMLAQECVARLSDEQLRSLQIPLGIAWDVLNDSKK